MTRSLSPLDDIRITAVIGFIHRTTRGKFIGRNAKKEVHGIEAVEPAVRIHTDHGIDGIGFGRITQAEANALIGKSLADIWQPGQGMESPLGRADHALFDLVGKALGLPAWELMGGGENAWVPVYDTTLYFSDLLPEHAGRGIARLVEEMEYSLDQGHRAFKIKVGRGARWMDAVSGLARDIEVVNTLARAAPSGVQFMADANDQYGLETARRFLGEIGEHLAFIEEPFPESIEHGLALRTWISDRGLGVLLADGESEHDPKVLFDLARAGALDVLQPDIRALGLSLQWRLGQVMAQLPGAHLAPHCWGSYLGTYKMLQLARGVGEILTCELDPMHSDLFDDAEWALRDGRIHVPDRPGCGLHLREDVFRSKYLPAAWVVGTPPD